MFAAYLLLVLLYSLLLRQLPVLDVAAIAAGLVVRAVGGAVLAARLGANARAVVQSEMSWTRNAERTESVYERVVGKSMMRARRRTG